MRGLPEDEEFSTPQELRGSAPTDATMAAYLSGTPSDLWRPSATMSPEVEQSFSFSAMLG